MFCIALSVSYEEFITVLSMLHCTYYILTDVQFIDLNSGYIFKIVHIRKLKVTHNNMHRRVLGYTIKETVPAI